MPGVINVTVEKYVGYLASSRVIKGKSITAAWAPKDMFSLFP